MGSVGIKFTYNNTAFNLPLKCKDEDDHDYDNLVSLFGRQQGTYFRVGTNNRLERITGWRGWFSYQWNRVEEKDKVKTAVDAAIHRLNADLSSVQNETAKRAAIHYLFDKSGKQGIGRFGKALCNQKFLKCDNLISQILIPKNTLRVKLSEYQFMDITDERFTKKKLPFCPFLNLGEQKLNYNFKMLIQRKKGQHYKLSEAGEFKKIRSESHYWLHREKIHRDVKVTISKVVGALNETFSKLNEQEDWKQTDSIQDILLQKIFNADSTLCRLNRKLFDRSAIGVGSYLEKKLYPELNDKRGALVDALKTLRDVSDSAQKPKAEREVELKAHALRIAEHEFVMSLGTKLERHYGSGTSGVYYGKDRYGEGSKTVVFKPEDEGPQGSQNPNWVSAAFKRLLPKTCLAGNSETDAEVAAWEFDRAFGFGLVPTTTNTVCNINGREKISSAQAFVENTETLDKYLGLPEWLQYTSRKFKRWYCGNTAEIGSFRFFPKRLKKAQEIEKKLPQEIAEKLAGHNFIIEDTDAHLKNILCRKLSPSAEQGIAAQVFQQNSKITDEEIKQFVHDFFVHKKGQESGNQQLLSQFFYKDPKSKHMVIKIDNGASFTRCHPKWEPLAERNKHTFEVLPNYQKKNNRENAFINNQETFDALLYEKTKADIRRIFSMVLYKNFNFKDFAGKYKKPSDKQPVEYSLKDKKFLYDQVFDEFVSKNSERIKKWIMEEKEDLAKDQGEDLVFKLLSMTADSKTRCHFDERNRFQSTCRKELLRIKEGLKARKDSFEAAKKLISEKKSMRELLLVTGQKEFEALLKESATLQTKKKISTDETDATLRKIK